MFDSLHIKGFRAFDDLQIHGLGAVNLLVGKNNVGKTTVLEALKVRCAGTAAISEVNKLLMSREEIERDFSEEGDQRSPWNIDRLFNVPRNGFEKHAIRRLSIGPIGTPQSTLTLELGRARELPSKASENSDDHVVYLDAPLNDTEPTESLLVTFGGGHQRVFMPASTALRSFSRRGIPEAFGVINCHYVPSRGFTGNALGELWDTVVLTDLESDVLNALRIVEPVIERISLVQARPGSLSRVALIRRTGSDKPEPLKSVGDGMSRIFEMALGLANSKGGILLVDEIENGIHYSVLKALWTLMFEMGTRLGCQVFATTHSWDCIEAFQKAASAHPAKGALIALYRRGNKITATTFDERRLEILTKESIEVR